MELKALPEGQAKEVTIPGVGTHPHQTVSGALKKEGVKVHVCKITGRTVLIWENRNDAA
jgi:hypothetical protein